MTGQPFVRLKNITRRFDGGGGVNSLSIDIPEGGFTVLLGPSGCGKSTTLRLIAGLEPPDSGRIEIGGRDVTALGPSERGLTMVFQSYALFPHLNVAENIVFGLRVRGMAKKEREARLAEALDLTGLNGYADRKAAQLSGGQRQRVALARAIVARQPLCLMDEPLSNLDAKLRHSVRQEIRSLQRRLGMTLVYVTHDQTEAMGMADQIVLLNQGRVEHMGPPAELYERPASAFTASFIGSPAMTLLPADILPFNLQAAGILPAGLNAKSLQLGVRAEDFILLPEGSGRLPATVVFSEFLGAETYVYLAVDGAEQVIARLPGRNEKAPGTRLSLNWSPASANWFDRESGRCLPNTLQLVSQP
ncbi:ABC transporter ATP-binding protein [Phyllobacterium sp. BT25]|uniref:ABC transporter ATP-binding protein n=1 Tax=Phyllobacterium pellucidum TaxID=2740464 RepID=A0A849W061_9HYPH|nr:MULTISPECIES: ABC transporter ATP-binding protein [Phyllobacterium]NTS33403.1 ABC transporter ATP-binding protein [Phyllobacterium pellucidum]